MRSFIMTLAVVFPLVILVILGVLLHKPRFKVGDCIYHQSSIYRIYQIKDRTYLARNNKYSLISVHTFRDVFIAGADCDQM